MKINVINKTLRPHDHTEVPQHYHDYPITLGDDSIQQIRNIHYSFLYNSAFALSTGTTGGTMSRTIHFCWWFLNTSRPLAMSIPVLKSCLEQSVTPGIFNCFIQNRQYFISTSQEHVMILVVQSQHIARAASPLVKPENHPGPSPTTSWPSVTIRGGLFVDLEAIVWHGTQGRRG